MTTTLKGRLTADQYMSSVEGPEVPLRVFNVRWFGAVGDGVTDDSVAIQRALDNAKGDENSQFSGGVVYFPRGVYNITTTLTVGGSATSDYTEGLTLRGEAGAFATTSTSLRWAGVADGGPILRGRNSHTVAVLDLGFDGGALAAHCIHLRHVVGDIGNCGNWTFERCKFSQAKVYNVLVGDPDVSDAYGDLIGLTFRNCVFQASTSAATTAHVRLTAQYTFGTAFDNCRWLADVATGYPTYGLSMNAGTANVVGGTFEVFSGSCVYLDGKSTIPFPAVTVTGVESQSGNEFLRTAQGAAAAPQRATVLTAVFCSDIVSTEATVDVYWDVNYFGALLLNGCRFEHDVEVASADAKVFTHGSIFDLGKTFIGAGAARVFGTWVDGNGSTAGALFSRVPGGKSKTFAVTNAATKGTNNVHALYDSTTASTSTGFSNPDVPRNLRVVKSASWDGGTITVAGTDIYDRPISELFPALTAGTEVGVKVFKTVTSLTKSVAAGVAGNGVSVGTGDLLGTNGIPVDTTNYIFWEDGVVAAATLDTTYGGFTPTTAPDGAHDYVLVTNVS